jgi:lysophospholipase L1-like esterase
MRFVNIIITICMVGFAVMAMAAGPPGEGPPPGGSGDPFQDRLDALAEKDKNNPPAQNGVEFVGSSMFEGWTDVAAHMAPIPAFNRAIGGSKTANILSNLDQLVLQYKPKVVVLYSGINDVSEGVLPETAALNIRKIIEGIQTDFPETRIIYIPILDTSNRPETAGLIEDANNRVKAYAESNTRVIVLDISSALVDKNGNTRPEFLASDGFHYNEAAYEAMAQVVKPVVEKLWSR